MPEAATPHRPPGWEKAKAQRQARIDARRASQPHRKLYNKSVYQRFRRMMLEEFPLCQDCQRASSTDIHHVRGLAEHPDDLVEEQWVKILCGKCHDARTARGE